MYYVCEIQILEISSTRRVHLPKKKLVLCTSIQKKKIAVSRGKKEIQVYALLYTLQIQEQEFYPQPYLDKCQEY